MIFVLFHGFAFERRNSAFHQTSICADFEFQKGSATSNKQTNNPKRTSSPGYYVTESN